MLIAIALAGGVVLAALIIQYNKLVYLRQLVRNAWSDVDVYLKRRADLVPNLAAAVKAYAQHENATFEGIANAMSQAMAARDIPLRAGAENALTSGLRSALVLAENYPELKASHNFLALQQELTETERLIANARQYYNACVRDYNTKIEAFPSNLMAGLAQCRHAEFFETETASERLVPSVASGDAPLSIQQTSTTKPDEGEQSQKVY